MRKKTEQLLAVESQKQPHAQEAINYGDRIEVRCVWARNTDPISMELHGATQVFVIEREVIPISKAVKPSKEKCYAITSLDSVDDLQKNAENLLKGFRGHWSIEGKNHYRRDVTYGEDRSPMKNHNAARVLATMKMVAIFLCEIKAHRPQSERECSLPEFHRSCSINAIDTVINWITRKYNPLRK